MKTFPHKFWKDVLEEYREITFSFTSGICFRSNTFEFEWLTSPESRLSINDSAREFLEKNPEYSRFFRVGRGVGKFCLLFYLDVGRLIESGESAEFERQRIMEKEVRMAFLEYMVAKTVKIRINQPNNKTKEMKSKTKPKHGWRSACDPKSSLPTSIKTFSVSFYREEHKSSGRGTKKVSVGYRLKGPVESRDAVIHRAEEIVKQLDDGWVPKKKSESLS